MNHPPPPPEDPNTLPHDRDAEEAVIGSVLIDPESYPYINLDTDDFYIHRHRFIWAAMVAIRANGQDIDHLTVSAELEKRGQLVDIGGTNRLLDMISRTPNVYHVESYADIIRNTAVSRRYVDLAGTIAKQAMNGGVDEAAAIEALTSQSKGERDGRHISEGLEDLEQFIMERRENPVDIWGIPTGFIDLDKRTGGLHKQHVFMLSGESGTGKTTIVLQWALNAAKNKHGVIIFELEMPEQSTVIRLTELECGVPYRAIMSGKVTDEQLTQFKAAKARIKRMPIHIVDDPGMTTTDLRRIIAQVNANKFQVDFVMLDYLGLLGDDPEYGKSDFDQTRAKKFREVCRYTNVAGVAIQDKTKPTGGKAIHSMSGGAKVRFGADEIYFIEQDDDNPQIHYLKAEKERYGDQAKAFITLYRNGLAFQNSVPESIDLRNIT